MHKTLSLLGALFAMLWGFSTSAASVLHTPSATPLCVFDMTERNLPDLEDSGDRSRQLYSATYLCDIAGYPYATTHDLDEALRSRVIVLSSLLRTQSFTVEEIHRLAAWVENGGHLVATMSEAISGEPAAALSDLFGIDTSKTASGRENGETVVWNPDHLADPELVYFDEVEEQTTSVGAIITYGIEADGCDILANFGMRALPAVTRNVKGDGGAYAIGVRWRDVVQRNQLNKDNGASRQYNNGFEPSADIWAFLIRSICAKAEPVSAWKFTVPAGYTQLLVPTHDCDSRTAYDAMHFMGDYEREMGFRSHYFFTTHYYRDKDIFGHDYLSAFYNEETIPKAQDILDAGHTGGSHSVCHFPDFHKCKNTDVVTLEEYARRATCVDGVSTGASTWAEMNLSKQLLERDLGNRVRSFRSGHLCVNPDFNQVMEDAGYEFSSCYTAGDLLSEFPFFGRIGNSWDGRQSTVLEMPLHISDVNNRNPVNNDNWESHPCVDYWEAAMHKLRGNYASAILLIHPNRDWKMTLQKRLWDRLDHSEVGYYNFEDYGDFWKKRLATDFSYIYDASESRLTILTDISAVDNEKLTFAVEFHEPVDEVIICDHSQTELRKCTLRELEPGRLLAVPDSASSVDDLTTQTVRNPLVKNTLTSDILEIDAAASGALYSLAGQLLRRFDGSHHNTIDISALTNGCYIVRAADGRSAKIIKR